jgi:hypothetical protein
LLAAQAVAAEVVTGFSSIDGIDLDEELRTLNKERRQRGASVLRDMMNQAKRTAVDFLVPLGLEEHLKRSPDGISAYQFWRSLAPEEKFLLKALELEAGGVEKIGAFQDLGRAYGIADYEALLGPVKANEARTKLPAEFPRPDHTRWDDIPANEREQFAHSITRHIYHALNLLGDGAESDRAVKHLVDSTNFWQDRHGKHLVILGYLYQITEPIHGRGRALTRCEQPRQQPGKPVLRPVVFHRHRHRLPLPDQHDEFFAPRDARVNEIALQQQVLLHRQRNHNSRKFRTL